jgi:AcrR family transcriptional regulator
MEVTALSEAKKRILNTASDLFYQQGFKATGINQIIDESDVAKVTLYDHFSTKDELIESVLKHRHQEWLDWFEQTINEKASAKEDRLLAIFDALEEWFRQDDFSGCAFINASAEFNSDEDSPHRQAARFKEHVQSYIKDLVRQTNANNPDKLAKELFLLVEGATVTAHVTGDDEVASEARETAEILFKEHNVN